jgi:hypothetical protein
MSRYLHLRAVSNSGANRLRIGPSRVSAIVLLGAFSTVIAAFGLPMGAASATSAPRAVAPRTSVFCSYADNASKSTSSTSNVSLTPASMQATYSKLKSEESFILANSPSQLKGDFQELFGYLNKFIAALAAVKYNFEKLSATEIKSFSTADTKPFQAAVKSIDTYLTKVCGLKTTTTA